MAVSVNDPYYRHLFDGTSLDSYSAECLNLSVGAPGPDLLNLCVELFQDATQHRLEKEKGCAFLFQYGITAGLWEYRKELSEFLTKQYGSTVRRENLILTCGASHGLQLSMGTFLCPNAVIFVEELTYMIALQAFKQYPLMKVVPVPMTEHGVDALALEKIAANEKIRGNWEVTEEKPFWAMFYTIPHFHNPTGITMSKRTCEQVVQVACKLDFVVLCDDVYNLLYYEDGFPPKRLIAYDTDVETGNSGHVISNGTFSKILAPGIRVGWLELPTRLAVSLRNCGVLRSGGACNHYMSGIVTSLLELGLQEKHVAFLRNTFKERMNIFADALCRHLPHWCSFNKPTGGYFIWVKLPEFINAEDFNNWCIKNYKVGVLPGERFSVEHKNKNYFRISIAFQKKEMLELAAERLGAALSEYVLNQ